MGVFLYVKNFINDRNVASISPSSVFAVERICKKIDFAQAQVIVEYGPGAGVFTKYLLKHMAPTAKLILFELNQDFVKTLRRSLKDPRVVLLNESAEEVLNCLKRLGIEEVDTVISGIPFSFMKPEVKEQIIADTAKALRRNGRFLTYQVFPPRPFAKAPLRKLVKSKFNLLDIEYEFRNIPPLEILESAPKK